MGEAEGLAPIVVIVAMGLVTLALRVGGYFVMGRVRLTPRVRRGLEALPGAIIVATVLPVGLKAGAVGVLALSITALAMIAIRKDLIAVALGIAAAAFARSAGL